MQSSLRCCALAGPNLWLLIHGFIANIHFCDIETPLKAFVAAHANLVRHCNAIHAAVTAASCK